MGISADLLPQIFDLFIQGQRSLDRTQGGLGIGLTLVRRLVDLHGGSIEAASAGPGLGSRFTVFLPLVPRPATAVATPAAGAPHPSRRVLVVEDNEDSRDMLRQVLEHAGHEVHETASGQAGVDLARTLAPDVALIDIGLPGLDGYEVARRIRAHLGRSILLIAITGYGQPEDQKRAYEAGFDAHLTKPVAAERLKQVMAGLQ